MFSDDQLEKLFASALKEKNIDGLLLCDIALRLSAMEKLLPPGGQDREAIKIVGRKANAESRKKLAATIRDILIEQVQYGSLREKNTDVFGFSPAGFNQILVFIGDEPPKEMVAANPRMSEILRNDDHNIYIWGIKAEAN